jgi:hypothetical protein
MHKRIFTLVASTMLLAGCVAPYTEAPVATNFKKEDQKKLQSASHWQLIAEDTSAELIRALPRTQQPLYVVQNAEQSPFQKAFNQQLISSLIAAGYPVMKHPNDGYTLTVDVKADPVRFSDHPKRAPFVGEATTIAGGLWVLRNIYRNTSPGAAMMGTALSYDIYNFLNSKHASGPTPKTELLVTASVSDKNRYYANSTNVYYTTDSDWHNYRSQLPVTHFELKGN